MADDRPVSALVVLRHDEEGGDLTSAAPSPPHRPHAGAEVVDAVTAWFRAHGLEPGPAVGISFAITGSADAFGALWPEAGGLDSPVGAETVLPLDRLPADVATWIDAVVLTPPPDFGPTHP